MSRKGAVLRGSGIILGGQIAGQALSLLRNVIVARMISQEDFGIAATFMVTVSLLESISDLSVDRLLIQAKDGNEPGFQASAQLFQVVRGGCVACVMFLLAYPVARLFAIPQALWALQWVSIIPLIRGFMHLDPKRMHREMKFGRDTLTELTAQIVVTGLAWPLARRLGDYSAMLWILVLQALTLTVVSHLVAARRYALAWDRAYIARMVKFGWPLVLNGLLMFTVLQGDRFVIGAGYDMTQLAIYTVAVTITWQPMAVLIKCLTVPMLPLLAREQTNRSSFCRLYAISAQSVCIVGILSSVGFIFLGKWVVVLLYGGEYAPVGSFIGWLAIMQALRIVRTSPTVVSLALGDTMGPLVSNVGRVSVFPLLVLAAYSGVGLRWIAGIGCVGEFVALGMLLFRLWQVHSIDARLCLHPVIISSVMIAVSGLVASSIGDDSLFSSALGMFGMSIALIGVVAFFPEVRRLLVRSVS